jgi:hypothetical protein
VQREINEKRQELLAKEESLRFVFKVKATCHVTKEVATGTWRVDLQLRDHRASSATRIVACCARGLQRDVVYPEALIVSACTLVENFSCLFLK